MMLIQLDHSIHIDLPRRILVRTPIRREVLRVNGRLLPQPLQQPLLHFRFRDQRLEGVSVGRLNVRDERSGIREELGL